MKKRLTAFIITAAAMSLLTFRLSFGICDMVYAPEKVFPQSGEVYVDGTDFTGIINAGISAANAVFNFAEVIFASVCYFMLITAASVVVWAIFGSVTRKKCPAVSPKEQEHIRRGFLLAMLGTDAAVLIMDIVYSAISGNGCCFLNMLIIWQNPLFMWVFIISRFNTATDGT